MFRLPANGNYIRSRGGGLLAHVGKGGGGGGGGGGCGGGSCSRRVRGKCCMKICPLVSSAE